MILYDSNNRELSRLLGRRGIHGKAPVLVQVLFLKFKNKPNNLINIKIERIVHRTMS